MQERQTKQKQKIYEALTELNHPTATEVYAKVCETYSSVSRATVFRVLGGFVGSGRAQELRIAGNEVRYDYRIQPHYHARCKVCGRVSDVYAEGVLSDGVSVDEDFRIEGVHVEFYGQCGKCNEKGEK